MSTKRTAKLFLNGRSQAVRLPADFRFEGTEVFIERDPQTGSLTLSPKPHSSWLSFLELRDRIEVPSDFMSSFMSSRGDALPRKLSTPTSRAI